MQVGPRVSTRLVDGPADLLVWGVAPDRQWWALLVWTISVTDGRTHVDVWCSGWVPASAVFPSGYVSTHQYGSVLRLRLPADQKVWPTPWRFTGSPTHHFGVVVEPV